MSTPFGVRSIIKYLKGYLKGDRSEINILVEQIIMMLYTIRNNLVHGNKNPGEANDVEVVGYALPILEIVVTSFIYNLPEL